MHRINLYLHLLSFCLASFNGLSQSNLTDTAIKVLPHWTKTETQSYLITESRYRLNGTDTIHREQTTYDIEVTVLDKGIDAYTIEWLVSDISTNSTDPFVARLLQENKVKKIIFRIDTQGSILEVINWQEIAAHMKTAIKSMRKDVKNHPEYILSLKSMEAAYANKEAIKVAVSKDVLLFLRFHGDSYTPGVDVDTIVQVPDMYGAALLDAAVVTRLEEVNEADKTYTLSFTQSVDEEQLINSTFNYFTSLADFMNIPPPSHDEIKELKNETVIRSIIDVRGWVVHSQQTSILKTQDMSYVEQRVMERQ